MAPVLGGPEELVAQLRDADIEVRDRATHELRRLGPPAFDALGPEVVARHPELRHAKLRTVRETLKHVDIWQPHLWCADRADILKEWPSLRALSELGPQAIRVLIREMGDRFLLAAALGLFDDPLAAAVLDELAKSPETRDFEFGGERYRIGLDGVAESARSWIELPAANPPARTPAGAPSGRRTRG